ncbi:PHP domain-containing protein [Desulfotruncus alcoholivorax]|uniref:PHP domain-containing protein n=1 Tax=Desulfotruncus alcoholivorax TaxID=265477 RepID=UPI00041D3236|nr:PHP domain-containing protein [Desulfotruncus alcoholivorax]
MLQLYADWHTHSCYSDGSMTPEQIVAAAARRGLDEVAITDHGPRGMFIGVRAARVYLELKEQAARLAERYSIRVLVGAEANVVSLSGDIDIPDEVAGKLDILIAGLHPQVWCKPVMQTLTWILPGWLGRYSGRVRAMMRGANTKALVAAIYKNRPAFVSHPGLMMDVDLDEIARACSSRGCAMEINAGHHYDRDGVIKAALKWGAPLVVNSDAHYPESVGELAEGLALLAKNRVPPEQVLNAREGLNYLAN